MMNAASDVQAWIRAYRRLLVVALVSCAVPGVVLFGTLLFEDNFTPLGVWRGPSPFQTDTSPALVEAFGLLVGASPYLTTVSMVLGLAVVSAGAGSTARAMGLLVLLGLAWVGTAHAVGTAHSCWGATPFRLLRSVW